MNRKGTNIELPLEKLDTFSKSIIYFDFDRGLFCEYENPENIIRNPGLSLGPVDEVRQWKCRIASKELLKGVSGTLYLTAAAKLHKVSDMPLLTPNVNVLLGGWSPQVDKGYAEYWAVFPVEKIINPLRDPDKRYKIEYMDYYFRIFVKNQGEIVLQRDFQPTLAYVRSN